MANTKQPSPRWTSRVKTAALCGASIIALGLPAQAQDTPVPVDVINLDQLTVYGAASPIPVFDYPGQVTVIDRDEIELLGPSTISDILRDVPGVEFSGGPRRTGEQPSIRGFGGESLQILLDGVRQNFISAHDGRFFIDPALVQQVEVLRGPASALYGSGATGGVLAFDTVDAADLLQDGETWGMRFRGGYQTVNEETLGSATFFGRYGTLDLLGTLGFRDSGDIELGSGGELPSDDDILTGMLKGSANLTEALRLEAAWIHFTNEAFEPNNGQGVAVSTDPILGGDVDKEVTTDTFRAALAFDPVSTLIDLQFNAYYADTEVEETDDGTNRTTVRDIETTGLSFENRSTFGLGDNTFALAIGGEWYEDEQVGEDSGSADGTRDGVPDGEAEFYGVYAELESRFFNPLGLPGDLLVIPGVRFDRFESEADGETETNEDDEVSYRLASSYGPVEWLRLFGSYTESFRAPSINELYLDGQHFAIDLGPPFTPNGPAVNTFVPNPDLIPEKLETVEFGIGFDFANIFAEGDAFQAKASYYETEAEDLIDISVLGGFPIAGCFDFNPFSPCNAGTTESRNVDNAEIDGFELEAIYESRRFRTKLSYSEIDGENTDTGEDLGILTPDRLALDLRLKMYEWNAVFGTRLQFADDYEEKRFPSGSTVLTVVDERDSYAVVDLYAAWTPVFIDGLRFDVGVDNVFDEDYERVNEGVSEPGVNGKVAVSFRKGF